MFVNFVIADFKYEGNYEDFDLAEVFLMDTSRLKNIDRRNGLFLIRPVV